MRSVLPMCMYVLVPCAFVGSMADSRSGQHSVWMWLLRMHEGGDCSGRDCGSCVIVLRGAVFMRSELKLKVYFPPKLNYRGLTTIWVCRRHTQ